MGGAAAVRARIDAAVAVELVHDFSLLHDDVMDGDLTRRGRPAAWAVFGINQAILAGDALQALAVQQLSAAATLPRRSRCWRRRCWRCAAASRRIWRS